MQHSPEDTYFKPSRINLTPQEFLSELEEAVLNLYRMVGDRDFEGHVFRNNMVFYIRAEFPDGFFGNDLDNLVRAYNYVVAYDDIPYKGTMFAFIPYVEDVDGHLSVAYKIDGEADFRDKPEVSYGWGEIVLDTLDILVSPRNGERWDYHLYDIYSKETVKRIEEAYNTFHLSSFQDMDNKYIGSATREDMLQILHVAALDGMDVVGNADNESHHLRPHIAAKSARK